MKIRIRELSTDLQILVRKEIIKMKGAINLLKPLTSGQCKQRVGSFKGLIKLTNLRKIKVFFFSKAKTYKQGKLGEVNVTATIKNTESYEENIKLTWVI